MKKLNSLLGCALLCLAVLACSGSGNDNNSNNSNNSNNANSNSNNSNNSNSSNTNTSNSNSSSSSSAPAASSSGDNIYKNESAGIQFEAPAGWPVKPDGEQLLIASPDDTLRMVFWVPQQQSFDSAIKDLDKELSRMIKHSKTNGKPEETEINGMPTYTVSGTGQVNNNDIEWSVDIIKAKKPVIVLSFAQPGAWDKYKQELHAFVNSFKQI